MENPLSKVDTKRGALRRLRESGLPVIISGAGIVGEELFAICRHEGIDVACFCDGSTKASHSSCCGKEVIYTPDLQSRYEDALILISAAAIKDVVDLLHAMGFSRWIAGGVLLKDQDLSQSAELDYRKFAIENCIVCHDGFLNRDKIFIRSVDLIITERCSLRCKDCSNLMQYYQHPRNVETGELLEAIDAFFKVVDAVMDFRLIGGETFMNRQWPVFVERLTTGRRPSDPDVKRVVLYTNGTIVPNAGQLDCLKDDRVLVIATDYGEGLSRKLSQLKQLFQQNGIHHHVLQIEEWLDCAGIKAHHRTDDENRQLFKMCCAKNMLTLSDGKLFRCPYSANAARLSAVPDVKSDYVDLYEAQLDADGILATRKKMRDYLLDKDFLTVCDFCSGRPLAGREVPPAVQSDTPLPYVLYANPACMDQ